MADEFDENDDSFVDEPSGEESGEEQPEEELDPVKRLLNRLQSSGSIIRKATVHCCNKCDEKFPSRDDLLEHIIEHVTFPYIVLQRCDEDEDDDDWLSDANSTESFKKHCAVDKIVENDKQTNVSQSNAILNLKSIGNLCIRKVQKNDDEAADESTNKMESSGTLKLTIKHSSENQSFEVVNGSHKMIKTEPEYTEPVSEPEAATTIDEFPEPIDTKEGILKKSLIKTEPGLPQNVTIKSETRSPEPNSKQKDEDIIVPRPIVIPKVEKTDSSAIIEINCDSDKEDDEIIFVSSSASASEKKTIQPPPPPHQPQPPVSTALPIPTSTVEKTHSFNWNAPPKNHESLASMLSDKNTDDLFESLLSSHRKDDVSDLGTSEYISLDKLGPQHTCDVCNTRFTSIESLENHRKATGHSNQLVTQNNSSVMQLSPYQHHQQHQSNFLMNSLLPVKQLADTVSKIASGNSSGAFTHQQNIMVNIQSFPNQQGMQPPQGHTPAQYNHHAGMAQMQNAYGYRMPTPQYPPQYPPTSYPSNSYYPQAVPPAYNQPYQYPAVQPNNQILNPYSQPQPHNSFPQPSQPPPYPPQPQNTPHSTIPLPAPGETHTVPTIPDDPSRGVSNGIKIQNSNPAFKQITPAKLPTTKDIVRGQVQVRGGAVRGGRGGIRPGVRPVIRPGAPMAVRGIRPAMRGNQTLKRPSPAANNPVASPSKKRMDMLLPDRHDNEDCQVVSLQQQRDGPQIGNVQGSRNPPGVQLSNEITWKKTKVDPTPSVQAKDANAMANMLASRGIKITPKQKPTLPNLGSDISVTSSKATSNFSLPEEDIQCPHCSKTFSSSSMLQLHIKQAHSSQSQHKCDSCPMTYPMYNQLLDHKRAFHNTPNAEIGLPVVDLSQQSTLRKLLNLGITNFIPLANRERGGGVFGLPIVSAQNVLNGTLNSALSTLGSEGILSLGPVKPLPKV